MKKKIIAIIMILICAVLCFVGCDSGKYIQNGGTNSGSVSGEPNEPDTPVTPGGDIDEDTSDHYTASVYYDSRLFDPKDQDIYVVWTGNSQVKRVPLGDDGKADAGVLDGQYGVYLEGLPSKYAYDPSAYVATSDERNVTILLTDILEPSKGDGKGLMAVAGCYQMSLEGTYRTVIESKDQLVYYEFAPSGEGKYSVESWVNVYDNEINPYVVKYTGGSSFKFNPQKQDDGGFSLAGGYTKNFRFEYGVSEDSVGTTFTFAVGADSKSDVYPITVDFHIKNEGSYTTDYSDQREKQATQANTVAAERKSGETFIYADMNTKVFDMSNFRYNERTGFYHRYSATGYANDPFGYGAGYGPILCCMIKNTVPSYSTTSLYNANAVGPYQWNYLRLYNCWVEEENKFVVYDYVKFIRKDYASVCNSDGVCYVTQELKEFLQKYAENHSLYTDGVSAVMGTPEIKGYSANQDALWLFACGFYS